jgi:two-component system, NtrC family, sensor kinase
MAILFDKLPTILVLAVLVGIFLALRRYVNSPRLNLWTVAWGLILLHFVADWFPVAGSIPRLIWILSQASLQLSSIFFIASLTSFFENRKLTRGLVALFALPMMTYTIALAYDYDSRFLYVACSALLFFGLPVFIGLVRRLTLISLVWVAPVIAAGTISIVGAWRHQYDFGFLALLTLGFGLPAFLYLRRYPRWSSGVITSAGGFLLWGAVFPLAYFIYSHFPNLKINPELWNTPKFFVAFGMIMTLLEEKSRVLAAAQKRERKANEQLQKFAGITSRLLSGVDLNVISREIAEAVCETSTFSRVCILLSSDGKKLYPSGYAGMDASAIAQVEANCASFWNMDDVIAIFREGEKLGQASRLMRAQQLGKYNLPLSTATYPPDARWQTGNRVFVPLQSTRGAYVGCISLDDPRDLSRVNGEEIAKIELLAGDLAVTVDNANLHRQLVRSEKLAAIGQLVAGVAHELNNPLASIVGYSELMTDEIREGPPRQKLDKMIREAQRMRRIIENLLRFARQNSLEKKSTNLETLLQDVLALRDYHIRNHEVELKVQVESGLPLVAVDEDQFKQILLNLLNNSMDALEAQHEKKIQIRALRKGDRVVVHFDDNGPGFRDPNRVFDPFYTTKPVGKGTGLGLSICYGIVKEHGGEIQAANLERGGARVILELPTGSTKAFNVSPVVP